MKEIIEVLEAIETDFYNGVYTFGEKHDLIKGINDVLKSKHFIQK